MGLNSIIFLSDFGVSFGVLCLWSKSTIYFSSRIFMAFEISTLCHEIKYHSMKNGIIKSKSFFNSPQSLEIEQVFS